MLDQAGQQHACRPPGKRVRPGRAEDLLDRFAHRDHDVGRRRQQSRLERVALEPRPHRAAVVDLVLARRLVQVGENRCCTCDAVGRMEPVLGDRVVRESASARRDRDVADDASSARADECRAQRLMVLVVPAKEVNGTEICPARRLRTPSAPPRQPEQALGHQVALHFDRASVGRRDL
jgi:hypothetical protein